MTSVRQLTALDRAAQTSSGGARRCFWLGAVFLVFVALTGGSSRADVTSLIVLRPIAAVILVAGLFGLERESVRRHRLLLALGLLIIGVVAAHLVPLPRFIWSAMSGRAIVEASEQISDVRSDWRPLTLVPGGTWNAFHALVVPLAMLVLAIRMSGGDQVRLARVLGAIALANVILGILQGLSLDGSLNLYTIASRYVPIGLFANRNHFGAFLAFAVILTVVLARGLRLRAASERLRGPFVAGAIAMILFVLIVSGSRAGLLLAVLALGFAAVLFPWRSDGSPNVQRLRTALKFGVVPAIATLVLLLTQTSGKLLAISRLLPGGDQDGQRLDVWKPALAMARDYFPFGSGWGTFDEVFRVGEPYTLLKPEYWNHVHNDWLEVAFDGGLPGVMVIGLVAVFWAIGTWRVCRMSGEISDDRRMLGFLGSIAILFFGVASFVDYPLRVPFIECVFVIAAVWLLRAADRPKIAGSAKSVPLARVEHS